MTKTVWQQRYPASAGRWLAGMALGVLGLVPPAHAQFKFTQIDVPGSSATYAGGLGKHQVVGEWDDEDGVHGFVLRRGEFVKYDVPGSEGYTSINGINSRGERVGIYFANDRYYGYHWHHGVVTTIDPPGSTLALAVSINSKGQVVGFWRKDTEPRHGYIWKDGVFTAVDVPGAGPRGTWPSGINDNGDVVGSYWDQDGNQHGFLLRGGVFTTLDVPAAEGGLTFAQGINNNGFIVGLYAKADGFDHGFVLSDEGYTTIDVPGAIWTDIYAVNSMGDIAGAFEDETGVHGFRGTPAGRLEPDPPVE